MQFGIGGLAGNTWGGAPSTPPPSTPAGTASTATTTASSTSTTPATPSPPPPRFLQAHGAPADIQAALFAYNHSGGYVTDVLGWAARYAAGGAQVLTAAGSPVCQQAALGPLPAGTAGKVLAYAEAQLGKPYQWGATGPDAFDCSGLAMMAYRAAGITIPRTSQAQWAYGRQIPASQVQPGDLVFFAGADGTMTAPGHVGIVSPGHAHHDRRLRHRLPRRVRHLRAPGIQGRTVARQSASPARCRFSPRTALSHKV